MADADQASGPEIVGDLSDQAWWAEDAWVQEWESGWKKLTAEKGKWRDGRVGKRETRWYLDTKGESQTQINTDWTRPER